MVPMLDIVLVNEKVLSDQRTPNNNRQILVGIKIFNGLKREIILKINPVNLMPSLIIVTLLTPPVRGWSFIGRNFMLYPLMAKERMVVEGSEDLFGNT